MPLVRKAHQWKRRLGSIVCTVLLMEYTQPCNVAQDAVCMPMQPMQFAEEAMMITRGTMPPLLAK